MGNETFYGDGLKLSHDKLKLSRDNLSQKKNCMSVTGH